MGELAALQDHSYLIRRAVLLRSIIARAAPHLIDPGTGIASVSPSVIRGFLCADTFLHGARSMEAIVAMSALGRSRYFGVSELPSRDLLALHVSSDFIQRVHDGEIEEEAVNVLALSAGWARYSGAVLQQDIDGCRHLARTLLEELYALGYRAVRGPAAPGTNPGLEQLAMPDRVALLRIMHEHWLREHVLRGYDMGDQVDHELLLHPAVRPWDSLMDSQRDHLGGVLDEVLGSLNAGGFRLEPRAGSG